MASAFDLFLLKIRNNWYDSYGMIDSEDYLDGKIGQRTFSVYKIIDRRPSVSPFPKPEAEKNESQNSEKNEKNSKNEVPKSEPEEKSKCEMAVDDLVPKDENSPEPMMQNIPIRSR